MADIAALRPLSDLGLNEDVLWCLIDAAPDAMLLADEAGRILLLNRQTEALFGYERGDLLGKTVEELVPEQFRQAHRAHRAHYRAEPRTRPMGSGYDLFGRRSDGSEFPVEISLSPLRTEAGLLVVASIRDISERVAAEAERRQIGELLDATHDAILIFDADTLRFTYVNQGAIEQVGYSRDELLQMTMLHLAPEFTEDSLRELLEPFRRGERSSTMFTTVHRRRDGIDIPVEIILQPDTTEGGPPTAFIKLVRDISERVEIEERLRQASEELRVLEDRERIARDLHDNVIQRLFAAGMSLQAIAGVVATHDANTALRMEAVVDELDETIREIRSAIYGLQAQSARNHGLRHQILDIVEEQREALGFEPHLRFEGVIDAIPDNVAENMLAVLREALANVGRHARATAVDITIEAGDDIVLRVVDDGVGIPDMTAAGHGLRNMADRAAQLGGACSTRNESGSGTQVEFRIPNRARKQVGQQTE
jgi:PAS domain S-box-containing protein